jgi:chromosome partitioning protein
MGRVVAIANQKGGVGKTTTAISLSAALAIAERSVLLIDGDPQANSTRALGFAEDPERASLYDALSEGTALADVMLEVPGLPNLRLVPSDRNLTGAEVELAESHLDGCDYCRRRYKFEESLRRYVKLSAVERMPAGLLEKLGQLRGIEM